MSRSLTGTVVSDRPNKTIVVAVETRKTHPLYRKKYLSTKRYQVHDAKNEAKVGDLVKITETLPISAKKHFSLAEIVEKAAISEDKTVDAVTAEPEVKKPKEASK